MEWSANHYLEFGPHYKAAQFQAVAPFRSQYFISLNDNEKVEDH